MSSKNPIDIAAVEQLVRAAVESGRVLGLSLAVVEGDAVTYTGGFGRTSVEEEGVPVTPTTLFAIASISKVILAALVMRLVERGPLELDRPVVEYLPGFSFSDPALGARVTLHHLLSHTSGLPAAGKNWGPGGPHALRDFVWEQIPHYRFIAAPGRVYQYSNTAICMAGHVAEAVTGGTFRELAHERVLAPLGMDRTTFDRAVAMTYRLALPHETDDDGTVRTVHRWTDNASGDPSGFGIAPVADLANLARMFLSGGRFNGEPFLSAESVREIMTPHGDRHVAAASHPIAHWEEGYGLGMVLGTYRGERLARHGGMLQSFNNYFQLFPDLGRGFVLLTNYGDDPAIVELVYALHDAVLGVPGADPAGRSVLVPVLPAAPDRERWPSYEGAYLSAQGTQLRTVHANEGRLELEHNGGMRELVPVAEGTYFFEDGANRTPVVFLPPEGEGARVEHLVVGGTPYRRVERDPGWAPDPHSWQRLTGTFRDSSNLGEGAEWRLHLEGDALWLRGDWADEACVPFAPGQFLSSIGLIELDDAGDVMQVGHATRYFRVAPRSAAGASPAVTRRAGPPSAAPIRHERASPAGELRRRGRRRS